MNIDDTLKIFEEHGKLLEAGGNKPVLLNDPGDVWIIESQHVDIFAVILEGDRIKGHRQHIFRAPKGCALFGIRENAAAANMIFMAVGTSGSRIRELSADTWFRIAAENETLLEEMTGTWIANAIAGVGDGERIPRNATVVDDTGETELKDGDCARATDGISWIKCRSGSCMMMGRSDWPPIKEGSIIPLPEDAWLKASGDCVLSIVPADEVYGKEFSQFLSDFNTFIRACVIANRKCSELYEKDRMERRARLDKSMLGKALSQLGFILETKKKEVGMEINADYPLYAASSMVGAFYKIDVRQPESNKKGFSSEERLEDISRISKFRTREVMLSGNWHKEDNGPLVAFIRLDEKRTQPVALIPASPRSYDLYDPVKGTKTRVDSELAESLQPKAQSFYRPLPDRKITGRELFMMGMKGCWKDIWVVVLIGTGGALLNLITPWMTGVLFSSIIPEAERGQLLQMGGILLTCALAVAMFDITKGIALLRVEGRVDGSVQAAIMDRLLSLPVPFFENYTSGDLADRLLGVSRIRMILSGVTVNSILACIFASFNLFLLFFYSVSLAWIGIGLSILGMAIVIVASIAQVKHERKIVDIEGKLAGVVLQFINGIAKLRISGTEDRAFAKWAMDFGDKKKLGFKAGTVGNVTATFTSSYPILTMMAIFMWMIWKLDKSISIGGFLAFNAAYISFQNAMLQMSNVITTSLNIFPLYDRMRPIVENVPEVNESKKSPGELHGSIEINHVNFRYDADGPLILKNVSMAIDPGEFIAIVGGSGSGKSTLMRLLLGFGTPESGTIYYDGQDLSSVDVLEVRQQLGVVLQHGSLMQGDIRSNIIGSSNLTIDDAWEAARMVGVERDIKEMPMGMHTVIQAGGAGLSGGQRQRLVIARAIVKRPRILFFDEATSALDNKTQATVSRSLENLHVTRIVIAHRLSTIINADRIFVLQHGELIQSGTYDELMSQDGFFADLAQRQIA